MNKALTLSLLMSIYAPAAFSWGEMGHSTIGEIAERNLTPEAKTAINDILGPEKLALTAVWADSVRDDSDFDRFKSYHFISIGEETKKDSMTVLKKFPAILKDTEANRSVKIVALRYLVHVVGDIHQPFHVGLASDMGGNYCRVSWKPNQLSTLHAVWDGLIIGYDIAQFRSALPPFKEYSYVNYADDIMKAQPTITAESIVELDASADALYTSWAKESETLLPDLYPGATPHTYCQKDFSAIPTLTDEYKKRGAELTEKRLMQAGLRLATLLNSIFKNGSNPGVNASLSKEQVLDALDFNN
ncbi:MAG: S1/P1 nuclease [Bdellovibrionales bacterium]|nr:S1/P1 nuclease [Bdellovibrionales bacterium]